MLPGMKRGEKCCEGIFGAHVGYYGSHYILHKVTSILVAMITGVHIRYVYTRYRIILLLPRRVSFIQSQ